MVIVDQLRISDDGKMMLLNVHVNTAAYFDDIYLDKVTIMTADKVSEAAPELFTDDYVYQYTVDGQQKELALVLQPADFNEKFSKSNFSSDLFFVYIKCKGIPDPCTPCRLDEESTLAVTFDENILYQKVMDFTKNFADKCILPVGFTDFILLWNAFKAAVETEHYTSAIRFWNMLFDNYTGETASFKTNNCGCHG